MDYKARLLVMAVALLWGVNFVVIKWGVESIDPAMMTALRFFFTSVPLIFFVKKPTISITVVALYGVFFGAGIWGLVNLSIALGTPSGMSSLLLQSSAFFTLIVAVLFFDEKISLSSYISKSKRNLKKVFPMIFSPIFIEYKKKIFANIFRPLGGDSFSVKAL